LLPSHVSSLLKITDSGTFEKAVSLEQLKEIVPELVSDVSVFLSLADVNDKTEATPFQMADIIEYFYEKEMFYYGS